MNGVTTADLLAIQKHITGVQELESSYKRIAADVNYDQQISALDIVTLRNTLLGLSRRFPNNTSWRFVDKSFRFNDITSPWPFTELVSCESLSQDKTTEDFIDVK